MKWLEKIKRNILSFAKRKDILYKGTKRNRKAEGFLRTIYRADKEDLENYQTLMGFNHFILNPYVFPIILCFISIGLFIAGNFVINLTRLSFEWFQAFSERKALSESVPFPEVRLSWFRVNLGFLFSKHGFLTYVFLIGLIILLLFMYGIKMKIAYDSFVLLKNQKGDSRWTTKAEVRQQYKAIPLIPRNNQERYKGVSGTIIQRQGDRLYIDTSPTNNLYRGITRSGKGEMYVFATIDIVSRAEEQDSMIINDIKLELYKSSKKTLEERGYEVHLINLIDPLYSSGFNPIEIIIESYQEGNFPDAELMARTYAYSIFNGEESSGENQYFYDNATELLSALIIANVIDALKKGEAEKIKGKYTKKVSMYGVIQMFVELASQMINPKTGYTALDLYFSRRDELDSAKIKYASTKISGDRTKGNIYSTMVSKLIPFMYHDMAKMTLESSFSLKDVGFGDKPMAIFLGIPDYDESKHFLPVIFIRQLYYKLSKEATFYPSGKTKRKVRCILDEFGNQPPVEAMDTIITACLGRGFSFDLFIQADKQLDNKYGDNYAQTIKGNCGNQIYILSNDEDTCEHVSRSLGKETVLDLSRQGEKFQLRKTFTESTIEKPLLSMNQLQELLPGESVVKRVMKRTDNKGYVIRPTPIFNRRSHDTHLYYRYEYLNKFFPNPSEIDFFEVCDESRKHLNLEDYVLDYPGKKSKDKEEQPERKRKPFQIEKEEKLMEGLYTEILSEDLIREISKEEAELKQQKTVRAVFNSLTRLIASSQDERRRRRLQEMKSRLTQEIKEKAASIDHE